MKTKKEIVKENNHKAILDAAEYLINKHPQGINAITMDDIAIAASFTKRTVYKYFSSKETIQFEIMIRGYRQMVRKLSDSLDDSQTGKTRLIAIANCLYRFSIKEKLYFWLIMNYENQVTDFNVKQPLIQETYHLGEQAIGILIDTIKLGQSDQSFRKELNPLETSLTLWSCLLGLLHTLKTKKAYFTNIHQLDIDRWFDQSLILLANSLS